jgi:kynurenine formamidase
LLTG